MECGTLFCSRFPPLANEPPPFNFIPMSEDNIALIQSAYEAHRRGEIAAVFALLHPEVEMVQTDLLPWGGTHRGHEGARTFFRKLAEHTEALPEPGAFFSAGDEVVVQGRLRGKARASGRAIDLAIVHVWRVRERQVVRFAAYINTPAMLEALQGA